MSFSTNSTREVLARATSPYRQEAVQPSPQDQKVNQAVKLVFQPRAKSEPSLVGANKAPDLTRRVNSAPELGQLDDVAPFTRSRTEHAKRKAELERKKQEAKQALASDLKKERAAASPVKQHSPLPAFATVTEE